MQIVIANAKMTFIDKILGRHKKDPFDKAPFLLPWYFDKHKPKLTIDNSTLTWKFVEKIKEEYVGVVTLNDDKNVLGLFNAYVYIQPSSTGDSFCVWTRSNNVNAGFPTLTINLYLTKDLKPFTDSNKSILQLHADKGTSYLLNCQPKATISFQLNADKEAFKIDFPDDFKTFEEFITVSDIPSLYLNGKAEWNNTALVVIKPTRTDKVLKAVFFYSFITTLIYTLANFYQPPIPYKPDTWGLTLLHFIWQYIYIIPMTLMFKQMGLKKFSVTILICSIIYPFVLFAYAYIVNTLKI